MLKSTYERRDLAVSWHSAVWQTLFVACAAGADSDDDIFRFFSKKKIKE
jgi:hypothetical protein